MMLTSKLHHILVDKDNDGIKNVVIWASMSKVSFQDMGILTRVNQHAGYVIVRGGKLRGQNHVSGLSRGITPTTTELLEGLDMTKFKRYRLNTRDINGRNQVSVLFWSREEDPQRIANFAVAGATVTELKYKKDFTDMLRNMVEEAHLKGNFYRHAEFNTEKV